MATPADLSIVSASQVSPPRSPTAASTGTPVAVVETQTQHASFATKEFVGDVPEEFLCVSCQRVPREPQVTQCCRQVYCLGCLRAQGNRFPTAGEAREKGVEGKKGGLHPADMVVVRAKTRTWCCLSERELSYKFDPDLQHKIYLLEVKCQNEGCRWSGGIDALLTQHSSNCVHALVHCHDCAMEVRCKDLVHHRDHECRLRQVRCPHCDQEGTYAEIMGLDLALTKKHRCPKVLATCPNKCKGSKKFERGELAQHLTVCPQQVIDCDFKPVGCNAQPTRKLFHQHVKDAQQHHLLLLLNTTQTKIATLSTEIDILSKSVRDPTVLTSLACMKSQMKLGRLHLDGVGDQVTFRVGNYSHLERYSGDDGKWESPSFYFSSRYCMELVAYPGGLGSFMGRSLSIILLVHKPTDQGNTSNVNQDVGWPMDCAYIAIQISILSQVGSRHNQSNSQSDAELPPGSKSITAHICHLCRQRHGYPTVPPNPNQDTTAEILKEDDFLPSHGMAETGLLFQDSIILRVELTPCECTYD